MKFSDFLRNNSARKSNKDSNLAKALLKNSLKDLEFLNSLKIDSNSSRKLMSNYYDCLRSILEAISAQEGYKIYSHEAFTYYLKEKKEEEISLKFDRFRKIRNAINYYGEEIDLEQTKENINEIKELIRRLIKKYLGNL